MELVKMELLEWVLVQVDWYPCKKGKWVQTHAHRDNVM